MQTQNNISKIFVSLLLVGSLLFPAVVQFSHLFESHEHTVCGTASQHIHEKQIDCEINDFHLNSYDSPTPIPNLVALEEVISNEVTFRNYATVLKTVSSFSLRGPPLFA